MAVSFRLVPAFLAVMAAAAPAFAEELKARELFYLPVIPAKPEAKPVTPAEPKQIAKPVTKHVKKPKPPTPPTDTPAGRAAVETHSQIPIANAAVTTADFPLAMKYTVERRAAAGKYLPVSPTMTFHGGDNVRLKVEANDSGYLYVVEQDPQKGWEMLLPDPDIDSGNNRIAGRAETLVPAGGHFKLDPGAGEHRVFLVFSRRPQQDLQSVIRAVRSGAGTTETPKMQLAALVDRFQLRSRDLVYEKDTEEDRSTYVATPNRSGEAMVVVLLELKHE